MRLIKLISIILACLFRFLDPVLSLARRLLWLSEAQSKVKSSIPITTQFDGKVQIIGTGNISWGEHCRFGKDVVIETQGEGVIKIGDNVRINQGSVLVAHNKIDIGNDCLIGEYCSLRDANHNINLGALIRKQGHSYAEIVVRDDCWIGRGSAILKGVNLQEGCVIGANSVVTKNIPQNSIAVGSPAQQIYKRIT